MQHKLCSSKSSYLLHPWSESANYLYIRRDWNIKRVPFTFFAFFETYTKTLNLKKGEQIIIWITEITIVLGYTPMQRQKEYLPRSNEYNTSGIPKFKQSLNIIWIIK